METNTVIQGFKLPIKDKNDLFIHIGDRLNISFGDASVKYLHKNVEVYFNEETLQVCVKGGNITSTAFATSLIGYVKPEYEIINNNYLTNEVNTYL